MHLHRLLCLGFCLLRFGRCLPRGVVDVTDFGAVGNGTHDDTSALRAALNASFAQHAVLYFPARDYLITDSLDAVQDVPGSDVAGVNIVPARFHAHVLVGELVPRRAGDGRPRRPRLVLAAGSEGFGNSSAPKHMLRFHNPNCYNENENMNQILRGIDFIIRPGNPGAVAVHFHGAQGGTIQDVAVDAGGDGLGGQGGGVPALAGFLGAVGAGGSFVNVLVRGGRYGILARSGGDSESSSAVAGSTFLRQHVSAVHWQGQQSLVLVGTRIDQPAAGAAGAAVATTPGPGDDNHPGASPIVLVDCQVTCGSGGAGGVTSAATNDVVVDAGSSVFLHNVYARSCAALLRQRPLLLPALAGAGAWSVAHDVSYSVDDGDNVMGVAYVDGARHVAWRVGNVEAPSAPPPPDLLSQHVWNETAFPAFDAIATPGAGSGADDVDGVHADECASACGAAGDGAADDTAALQHCLDTCDAVVLPRGRYRISATLHMRDGGALVGLSPTHSQIIAGDAMPPSTPLLRTSTSRNTLAFVGLVTFWHIQNGSTLDWRAVDGRSIWRSNYETRVPACTWWNNYGRGLGDAPGTAYGVPPACKPPLPLLAPKSHVRGGGLFFNFVSDADVCLTGPGYRHLLVTAADPAEVAAAATTGAAAATTAGGRLRFYGMNLEHAMGEANAEVRGATQGIDIYGLKIEGSNTILWARDAADVNLWGLGGGADAFPIGNGTRYYPDGFAPYTPALFRIERTMPYRLASLLNPGRSGAGRGHPRIKPIHPLLNASTVRSSGLPWTDAQVTAMVATVWAPWPGYYVSKELWIQHAECNGPTPSAACNVSRPFERPIVVSRGHYLPREAREPATAPEPHPYPRYA